MSEKLWCTILGKVCCLYQFDHGKCTLKIYFLKSLVLNIFLLHKVFSLMLSVKVIFFPYLIAVNRYIKVNYC